MRLFQFFILLIFTVTFSAASFAQTEKNSLSVGLLVADAYKNNAEVMAAAEYLEKREGYSVTVITIEDAAENQTPFDGVDVLWYHRADSSGISESEKNATFTNAVKDFVESGGGLVLTLDAFKLLTTFGFETVEPELRYVEAKDNGWGRKLGMHAFRTHPVFYNTHGGLYIWNSPEDHICRQFGYYGDTLPANGKVVAVNWAYIRLKENQKIVIEYDYGKGKFLAVGSYTYFEPENFNRIHLETFIDNCLNYTAGNLNDEETHYWNYEPFTTTTIKHSSYSAEIGETVKWDKHETSMTLQRQFATDNYYDVSASRLAIMGKEPGGIDEVWIHPFMAFRDYEVGLQFSYRDTIYWCKDQTPMVTVKPESFERLYEFPRAFLREIITADTENPAGVVHYEFTSVYPAKLVIRFRSNLRFMWPYSQDITRILAGDYDEKLNAFLISNGDQLATVIGSTKPPERMYLGEQSVDQMLKEGDSPVEDDGEFFRLNGLMVFDLAMSDKLDIVFTGSNEGLDKTVDYYTEAITDPQKIYENTANYYQNFLSDKLVITSPDEVFNEGYKWALVGTDKFFVNTPGIGKALVAGYSTTARGWNGEHKVNGRPGYAWYFGRDAEWSGYAVLGYGDFENIRNQLDVFHKFQDLSGKIYHELTTSKAIHYDASDATPLYLILIGKYLRWTGDLDYIKDNWQHIKRAIDYCYSTDTDGDNLIENTNVGHGWIEGGALYGSHTTLYLASVWAEALAQSSYLAEAVGETGLAEEYAEDSEVVKNIVVTDYWNDEEKAFYYGKLIDGSFNPENTTLATMPLYFRQADQNQADYILRHLAGNGFSTNWGVRILSEKNPLFKPTGYHFGSVWPLFGGWSSLAEYEYGNYVQGFTHVMNNLKVYKYFSLGWVEEVLNGIEYEPTGVCPHQCWSETMVLQPLYEGMLGLKPDALQNRITIAPRFPFDWNHAEVKNISFKDDKITLRMERYPDKTIYTFDVTGDSPVDIFFTPALPAGTKVNSVEVDEKRRNVSVVSGNQAVTPEISLTITGKSTVVIYHSGGYGIVPVVENTFPGSSSHGFRIIESSVEGNSIKITVEGKPDSEETLKVYAPGSSVDSVTGAAYTSSDDGLHSFKVLFTGVEGDFGEKEIVIQFSN